VSKFGNRIRYIKTIHKGAGAARNRGIQEARNPLITFLDSDDEWMPDKIMLQRSFMKARPDILFCFTNIAIKKKDGNVNHFSLQNWPGVMQTWEDIFGRGKRASDLLRLPDSMDDFFYYIGDLYLPLLTGCYVTVITLMARREEAGDALHFAEDTKTYEDWECFARLAGAGKCAYLDCETAMNHTHRESRLTDYGGFERADALVTIVERVWGRDKEFQNKQGKLYQEVLNEHRLTKAAGLILRGQTLEAKDELRNLAEIPLRYRISANLPGSAARALGRLYFFCCELKKNSGRSFRK
jgi:glycosyltransferase involved in cell wall biosynthesis